MQNLCVRRLRQCVAVVRTVVSQQKGFFVSNLSGDCLSDVDEQFKVQRIMHYIKHYMHVYLMLLVAVFRGASMTTEVLYILFHIN